MRNKPNTDAIFRDMIWEKEHGTQTVKVHGYAGQYQILNWNLSQCLIEVSTIGWIRWENVALTYPY